MSGKASAPSERHHWPPRRGQVTACRTRCPSTQEPKEASSGARRAGVQCAVATEPRRMQQHGLVGSAAERVPGKHRPGPIPAPEVRTCVKMWFCGPEPKSRQHQNTQPWAAAACTQPCAPLVSTSAARPSAASGNRHCSENHTSCASERQPEPSRTGHRRALSLLGL